MLGIPLSRVSLIAMLVGPFNAVTVPVLGWLSDRGSNPHFRKMLTLLLSAVILFCGYLLVVAANLLHVHDITHDPEANCTALSEVHHQPLQANASVGLGCASWTDCLSFSSFIFNGSSTTAATLSRNVPDPYNCHPSGVSLKAALGVMGFILLEVGYDMSLTFSKSWVVTCSPREEHTSMLALGLVVGSVGGVSRAALGRVDFQSLLPWISLEG